MLIVFISRLATLFTMAPNKIPCKRGRQRYNLRPQVRKNYSLQLKNRNPNSRRSRNYRNRSRNYRNRSRQSNNTTSQADTAHSTSSTVPPPSSTVNQPESNDVKCIICLDTARTREMKVLPCEHSFHKVCCDNWLLMNNACPICRTQVMSVSTASTQTLNTSRLRRAEYVRDLERIMRLRLFSISIEFLLFIGD